MCKNIFKIAFYFFIILLTLLTSLIIVNLIPKEYIENNVKKSVQVFVNEGYYPKVKLAHNYLLDNYTDALMINTAYSVDSEKPLESAILMRRSYRPKENLKLEEVGTNDKPIQCLIENVNETNETYLEYSRYWHGYMIYLRPLLVFFNYLQIRIIFTIIIVSLSILLIYLAYKKINIYIALATFFMLTVSNFWAIGLSLHYSAVFIISLIALIYVILKNSKVTDLTAIFFIIGMLTSFFDMLTTPLLTLGIPLIFYITLNKETIKTKKIINIILLWGIGYVLMWMTKWIISDIVFNTGTIENALTKIMSYTISTEEVSVNILQVIKSNLHYISKPIIFLIVTTIVSLLLSKGYLKDIKRQNINYFIIGILPFLWFIIVKNHSYIHARFTFRDLLLTIFVLSIITMDNVKTFIEQSKSKSNQY